MQFKSRFLSFLALIFRGRTLQKYENGASVNEVRENISLSLIWIFGILWGSFSWKRNAQWDLQSWSWPQHSPPSSPTVGPFLKFLSHHTSSPTCWKRVATMCKIPKTTENSSSEEWTLRWQYSLSEQYRGLGFQLFVQMRQIVS
jgi:hypothetical protein